MDVTMPSKEEQLIEYLRNILKHQVAPKGITELRSLVKDAPKKLKLWNYMEENFPTEKEFNELLEKFPQYFNFNPDRTITITGPNYCTLPNSNSSTVVSEKPCDEVDGISHQSDLESDSDSSEDYFSSEMHKCQIEENLQDVEKQLIEYVQTLLKYQFAPLNISMLRILVKDTLNKPQLSQYIEKHCPTDEKFYEFLKGHPCFNFDVYRNITAAGSSHCTTSQLSSTNTSQDIYDEVDGCKNTGEYESDQYSDSESDHEIVPS